MAVAVFVTQTRCCVDGCMLLLGACVMVVDDDKGLLEHLRKNIIHENLLLTHYEFFADGSENMVHL